MTLAQAMKKTLDLMLAGHALANSDSEKAWMFIHKAEDMARTALREHAKDKSQQKIKCFSHLLKALTDLERTSGLPLEEDDPARVQARKAILMATSED